MLYNDPITLHGIMTAILWISGPVSSMVTMNSNGPKQYRRISLADFKLGGDRLQEAGLGTMEYIKLHGQTDSADASFGSGSRSTLMFIKKPPTEVQQGALENLCTMTEYTVRYNMRPPAIILRKWRPRLVSLGLVPDENFKEIRLVER